MPEEKMLNGLNVSAVENLINDVRENPELANEIKSLMFVFEDILLLDDRSMQRLTL